MQHPHPPRRDYPKRVLVALILLGIIGFHIACNYVISSRDSAPIFFDGGDYLRISFKLYQWFLDHQYRQIIYEEVGGYTSLFVILTFPFYALWGLSQKSAILTNNLFYPILVFSVYGIGRIMHSKRAGLFAVFVLTCLPGIFSLSRTYLFDFAQTAMVALSFWCLLKTEWLDKTGYSILLGVAVGISVNIRPSFLIFFLGPVLYYLYASFRGQEREAYLRKSMNLLLFVISSLPVMFIFYHKGFMHRVGYQLRVVSTSHRFSDLSYFDAENILFYLKDLCAVQALGILAALFLGFLVTSFFRNRREERVLLFTMFLIPYLFFTFVSLNNKDHRFTAPYLIVVALVISISLFEHRNGTARRILFSFVTVLSLFQFLSISCNVSSVTGLLDRVNERVFDVPNLFSGPAYEVDIDGRFHAHQTDYGLRHLAREFKQLERFKHKDKIYFSDSVNQTTRPIQYLIYENDPGFLDKTLAFEDVINYGDELIKDDDTRTIRFVTAPRVDYFITSSDPRYYEVLDIDSYMKHVKTIGPDEGPHFDIYENTFF